MEVAARDNWCRVFFKSRLKGLMAGNSDLRRQAGGAAGFFRAKEGRSHQLE